MPMFAWHDSLSVGVDEIDTQHKNLLAMINRLQESISRGTGRSEIGGVLTELVRHMSEHFAAEEKLMLSAGFPYYSDHRARHYVFHKTIVNLLKGLRRDQNMSAFQLLALLRDWWQTHILEEDKKLGDYLSARSQSRLSSPVK
ncbi:MAG: bacteriohemerythrin [Candidatus Zixiibacteriota bacterium]